MPSLRQAIPSRTGAANASPSELGERLFDIFIGAAFALAAEMLWNSFAYCRFQR
jgi:hypothetical protein